MPFILEPQKLSDCVELIDALGWGTQRTTSILLVKGLKSAIVETGHPSCGPQILKALDSRKISRDDVRYVLVTHRHGDHCGGATPLAIQLSNAIVAGHKYALATLRNPERLNEGARQLFGSLAEDIEPLPLEITTQELQDGDVLDLGQDVEIEIVSTPGHTSDHLAYYERKTRTLYTGDAAGLFGPHRHTVTPTAFPPSFKFDKYRASLERLQTYDPATLVFAHYGAITGSDVDSIFDRALSTLDGWREIAETTWHKEASLSAVADRLRDRFLDEVEVFPVESRPMIVQVMAHAFTQSMLPSTK